MKDNLIYTTRAKDNDPVRVKYDELDKLHWEEIGSILQDGNFGIESILTNYLAFIRRRELPRLLAHYEMFKLIMNFPGSIVELGVYTGQGFFTWANLLETFCASDRIRKVFGFDDFEGYSSFKSGKDDAAKKFTSQLNHTLNFDSDLVERLTKLHNDDNILRGVERCRIINGKIEKTVPDFVANTDGLRLSLLYIDVNLYEPTKIGLDYLFPKVVPGGIVAFNAYGQQPWEGEARAIEDYFHGIGSRIPKMEKFPFSTIPSAYFVKQ